MSLNEGKTYSSTDMKNVSLLKIGIDFKCHRTDCTSSLTAYSEAALENVQAEKYHGVEQGMVWEQEHSG